MKSNECITLSTFKILPVQLSIKKLNISKKKLAYYQIGVQTHFVNYFCTD